MSRVGNSPVAIPKGVEITLSGNKIAIKGMKGRLEHEIPSVVTVKQENDELLFIADTQENGADVFAGTIRALTHNMITGVTKGFEKQLELRGVGYKAQIQGKKLVLTLGFSHPINFTIPDEINVTTPSQTDIVVQGIDKQLVGQVAANIRRYRPPEPYKGKGVRYKNEYVVMKEGKKK